MALQPGVRGEELSTPPESKCFQLPCWRKGANSHCHSGGIWLRSLQEGEVSDPSSQHPSPNALVVPLPAAVLCRYLAEPPLSTPPVSLCASAQAVAHARAALLLAPMVCQHPPGAAVEWDGRHSCNTAKKQLGFLLGTLSWENLF